MDPKVKLSCEFYPLGGALDGEYFPRELGQSDGSPGRIFPVGADGLAFGNRGRRGLRGDRRHKDFDFLLRRRGGGPTGLEPIKVLKDTPIAYSTLVMQRRPDLYPPASENDLAPVDVFSPERWYSWQPKPWQYIPFNGGPRICIGQQFALTEMGYVLTRLFQRYERIDDHMGGVQPGLKADIVLQPAEGVRVGLWEARKR